MHTTGRVSVSDKQIFNGTSDVNQLVPFKHKWAWEKYLKGTEAHWMPAEVDLAQDMAYIGNNANNHAISRILTLILNETRKPAMVQNPPELGIYRITTSPECRQYLLRALFENTVHFNAFTTYIEAVSTQHPAIVEQLSMYGGHIPQYDESEFYKSILCVPETPTKTVKDVVNILHAIVDYVIEERLMVHYKLMELIFQPAVKTNMPGLYQIAERIVAANMRAAEFFASMVVVAINEAGIKPEEHELHHYVDILITGKDEPPPHVHLYNWLRGQLGYSPIVCRNIQPPNSLLLDAYYGKATTTAKPASTAVEQSTGGLAW